MLRLICGYAPQRGRGLEEKQTFCEELKGVWYMHSADTLVVCLGYFSRHVHRHIDGVHEGYGVGLGNLEGRMLLEFCLRFVCVKYMV